MACCQMSFEDVDKHLDAHANFSVAVVKPTDPTQAALQICPAYKAVKPVLSIFIALPFFPAKWKTAVQNLMGVLDMICP